MGAGALGPFPPPHLPAGGLGQSTGTPIAGTTGPARLRHPQSSTAAPAQHTNTEQKPVPEPATGTNAQDAKRAPATSAAEQAPKLEHFDPNMVDKQLQPCQDFYRFVCSKWQASNPIPADQVAWGTGSGLQFWNESVLRDTLQSSAQGQNRSPVKQMIGDYWSACMDESGIESAGLRDLTPKLQHINAMTNKSELADQLAPAVKNPAGAHLAPVSILKLLARVATWRDTP